MQFFDEILTHIDSDITAWKFSSLESERRAYVIALSEGMGLRDSRSLLRDASVSFRGDLRIKMLGACDAFGSTFNVFSFHVEDRLDVTVCMEWDKMSAMVAFRGDRVLFERLAVELRMFEDECFSHLRDDEAEQHHVHQPIQTLLGLLRSQGKAPLSSQGKAP